MKNYYSIVITITIMINFETCDSWDIMQKIPDEAAYYCDLQNITIKEETNCNFVLSEPNENGTVDVEINCAPNFFYILEVSVRHDANDEETCKSFNEEDAAYGMSHSAYSYKGIYGLNNKIGLQPCTEKGIIKLKYIYKGCYYFQFSKFSKNYMEEPIMTGTKYFDLPYSKAYFSNTPQFFVQYRPTKSDAYIEIINDFLEQNPTIYLKMECLNCSEEYYGEFKIIPSLNEETGLMDYSKFSFRNDTNIDIHCKYKKKHLVCSIQGVVTGEYYFRYNLSNLIRCQYSTVWDFCYQQKKDVFKQEIVPKKEHPPEDNTLQWTLIGIACIVLIIAIFYTTYLIISRCKIAKDEEGAQDLTFLYPDKGVSSKQNKVLLLYPRDTNIVMQTMEALRNAIKSEGIEVHDIHDPNQQNIIAQHDKKWILDKLIDKHIKIIIVQTYCGQIIEDSSCSAEKLYKKPTCFDDLFFYALSLIRARGEPNSYTKLFIVHMGFDKMEYTQFSFLNPSTRYGLPQNFSKLIEELSPKNDYKINIAQTETHNNNNDKLETFITLHKEMKAVIEDPKYLSQILKVSVSYPNNKINIEDTANIKESLDP